jgi:hypothetical protein
MSEVGFSTRTVMPPLSGIPNTNLEVTPKQCVGLNQPELSHSPTGPSKKQPAKLSRDSRLGNYFEYDLSKMVDVNGGFLVEESEADFDNLKEQERKREEAGYE